MGYSSVAEETRKAFASVARLEAALARDPTNAAILINLASRLKLARQLQEQLQKACEIQHVELCDYRLMPTNSNAYAVSNISRSLLEYQNVFSQIYDSLKNGKKTRAIIGRETLLESSLELAYTYHGSLGIILLAPSERGLFEGMYDASIEALFEAMDIKTHTDVRTVAGRLGEAVVKRVHDWTRENALGGFSVDVRWNRSDGRQVGEVIELRRLARITSLIEDTSDERTEELSIEGMLVGINLKSRTFHFVVPNGPDYKGRLAEDFPRGGTVTVGRLYEALITEKNRVHYATERPETAYFLERLKVKKTA